MNKEHFDIIFTILEKDNPSPQTELFYITPYTLLIAVVLSAQATDKSVNAITRFLFTKIQSPFDTIEYGEDFLTHNIQSIGLHQNKARYIMELSQQLIQNHNGEVPNDREELLKLSGVGPKTADVILNELFGEETIAVDTHVFRVAKRLHLSYGKDVAKVREDLLKHVPKLFRRQAHHWLILHGRYVCRSQKPQCKTCILSHVCPSSSTKE